MIEEKAGGPKHFLQLQIFALQPDQLRMDATAAMGVYVGTFVMNGETTQFLSAREKKFYTGPTSPEMMQALVQAPLDPRTLYNVLFDRPLDMDQWDCEEKNEILNCMYQSAKLQLRLKNTDEYEKMLSLNSPKVSVRLKFSLVGTKLEQGSELFNLKPPAQFRVYRLK